MSNIDCRAREQAGGVPALNVQFDARDFLDTEQVQAVVEALLGYPVSGCSIRRWMRSGLVGGGRLLSRRVLGRRLVHRADLERFLRRLVGGEQEEVLLP